jgi:hypothetical protein
MYFLHGNAGRWRKPECRDNVSMEWGYRTGELGKWILGKDSEDIDASRKFEALAPVRGRLCNVSIIDVVD